MRKSLKRIVTGLIISSMVFSIPLTGIAATGKAKDLAAIGNYSEFVYDKNYPYIKTLNQNDTSIIKKQRQEFDNLVKSATLLGGGVPGDASIMQQLLTNNSYSDVNAQWGWSLGPSATHQFIARQSIQIIQNTKGNNTTKYLYYPYSSSRSTDPSGVTTIIENADWPDINEKWFTGSSLPFSGHFYNINGKGLNDAPTSAKEMFLNHMAAAKSLYWSNRKASLAELGRAIHYLSDLNAPHHVTSKPYLVATDPYGHKLFEDYVDNCWKYYVVSTMTWGTYDKIPNYNLLATDSISAGRSVEKNAVGVTTNVVSNYDIACNVALKGSQTRVSKLIYSFLADVGENIN